MRMQWLLRAALFFFVILLVAVLAWTTLPDSDDPCANPQGDISSAVLADESGDQDALINRAIVFKGNCDKATGD